MSMAIISSFLQEMAETATNNDLDAHMNLISESVQLHGVPGQDVIGYEQWKSQCQQEFADQLITEVSYEDLKIIPRQDSQLMFTTIETIKTSKGDTQTMTIEVALSKEEDETWRMTHQRVLSDHGAQQDSSNRLQ
jgi:ketosteroid isomerase-like protein